MRDETPRLIKQLIRQLLLLNLNVKQLVARIDEARKPKDDTEQPDPPIVINPELQLPVAITEAYQAEQSERIKSEPKRQRRERSAHIWEHIRGVVEIIALIGIGFTVYFTIGQWDEMKKQTKAMNDSLDDNAATFKVAQRAWILPKESIIHVGERY